MVNGDNGSSFPYGFNNDYVIGPNGKSIFLPAAGYRSNKRCFNAGIKG